MRWRGGSCNGAAAGQSAEADAGNGIGIPYLAPELVLLYKSASPDNPCYRLDFQNAAPQLEREALEWLGRALSIVHQGAHAWEAEVKRLLGQSAAVKPSKR